MEGRQANGQIVMMGDPVGLKLMVAETDTPHHNNNNNNNNRKQ